MELGLAGKKILITGASQGIGAALAAAFANEGCQLILTARSAEKLSALRHKIMSSHNNVDIMTITADLTQPSAHAQLISQAGDIDVLINNAGSIPAGPLHELDSSQWRTGWDLKVFGYIDLTRAFLAQMKTQGHGVIINNIGNSGEVFDPNYIAGSTGNAALMAFTRTIGAFSLDDNIRVVGVNPGPVDTDRIRMMLKKRAMALFGTEDRYHELLARYPQKRVAAVHEVADLILFLASERASYISGTIISLDGGISSRRVQI